MKKVAIIGAGFSGLSVGKTLKNLGIPQEEMVIIEGSSRIGGLIQTTQKDGYCIDWGPQGLHSSSKVVQSYMDEIGLNSFCIGATKNVNKRYLVHKNKIKALPSGLFSFLRPFGLISFKSKVRFFKEPFIGKNQSEESLDEFFSRRLGKGMSPLINAFASGVYGGNHEKISVNHAFPFFKKLEIDHGSIVKGGFNYMKMKRKMKKESPKTNKKQKKKPFLSTAEKGFEDIIQHLAHDLPIELNSQVTKITKKEDSYVISSKDKIIDAENIILTISPNYLSKIDISSLDLPKDNLRAIPESPVNVVSLGFDEKDFRTPLKGYGFLSPSTENRFCLGILFVSSFFPSLAPPGKVLLRCFVGGVRQPDRAALNESSLVDGVLKDVKELLNCSEKPKLIHIARNNGIPQLEKGHQDIIDYKDELEDLNKGLFISGIGWGGISTEYLIKESIILIKKLNENLMEENKKIEISVPA
jgi:oxygen-dependent protoporphyrinogen oxidase